MSKVREEPPDAASAIAGASVRLRRRGTFPPTLHQVALDAGAVAWPSACSRSWVVCVCVCLSSLERLHLTMTSPGRQSPRIYRSDLFPHYVVMLVFAGCTFVFKRRCLDLRCDKFRRLPRAYPSPLVRSRCNMGARPSHCGIFELCDCGVVCCGASVCFLFDST